MIDKIKALAQQTFPLVVDIRHHIHAQPELSFVEYETAQFVAAQLTAWGIPHTTGVAGTGIIGIIEGKNPQRFCLGLRSELDALPIQEETQLPYKSQKDGVMHACGHDVHTSCLLGVAKMLWDTRTEWEGTVKLIIQPGEEKHPGGASLMIAAGALENPQVDEIVALHVYPHLPAGHVGFRKGQYMASADEIDVIIKGKGGHAALPHQTIDPIPIAAQVIVGLQQIVARKANPLLPSVITFGKIAGGLAHNIIPETVTLQGTLRTFNEPWRKEAKQWIQKIVTDTVHAFGADVEIIMPEGYPSLFNDEALTDRAEQYAKAFLGEDKVHTLDLRMAAEDFSFYTHHVPGCFFRIGTNDGQGGKAKPVHNPQFEIVEDAMQTAIGTMYYIIQQELARGRK